MQVNAIPPYDPTDNPTGCCPRFHPEAWENQELTFDEKPFVRASTVSAFHVPLNMGSVFTKTWDAIRRHHAEGKEFLVLSHDDSAWHSEHLFAVDHDVPGAVMAHLSGTFLTKVFEGPFSYARSWADAMGRVVRDRGKTLETLYFFYTTCPSCAKVYGKNYVVAVAKVA